MSRKTKLYFLTNRPRMLKKSLTVNSMRKNCRKKKRVFVAREKKLDEQVLFTCLAIILVARGHG